jgi:hypothetical protein
MYQTYQGGTQSYEIVGGQERVGNSVYFLGIIDMLVPFKWKKKSEYKLKSAIHGGKQFSVIPPDQYAERFRTFCLSCIASPSLEEEAAAVTKRRKEREKEREAANARASPPLGKSKTASGGVVEQDTQNEEEQERRRQAEREQLQRRQQAEEMAAAPPPVFL